MDPFESSLAQLKRTPLPEEWKSNLIDEALAESNPSETPIETIPARSLSASLTRLAISVVAACWMAIVGLQLTMPQIESPGSGPTVAFDTPPTGSPETEPTALSFPLFADRVAAWESLTGETL